MVAGLQPEMDLITLQLGDYPVAIIWTLLRPEVAKPFVSVVEICASPPTLMSDKKTHIQRGRGAFM